MFSTVETDFALNMLQQASVNETLVVSSISVIFALAMIQAGAKGNTKSQINGKNRQKLDIILSHIEIQSYYANLSSEIQSAKNGVSSRIANGFFLKFIIDDFISNATEGMIYDMVTEDTVRDVLSILDAVSILVNAIYFHAKWLSPFDKTANTNGTFYGAGGVDREVSSRYTEDADFQLLSLPYKDTSYAMNILLPKERFGLSSLRSKLTGSRIQDLLSRLDTTYITLKIPKMKIETQFPLKEALIKMGLSDMFDDKSDLSGIAKEPPLKVSDAAHRAIIQVDEDGTTAAAATVLKVVPLSATLEEPLNFSADHPFLFMLTKDNNPLFIGQFVHN
ncbi:unnamed protein product [Heligmosomoides polygyrus]|uniref:SERPIN domain-containing protein n=1 Tax=Heligmosomoides polygyrus TaxID=6339 RepID=A0A183FH93_HELPZ|nr:unnamed protein product [Heligmosomoides polygyrus]